MYRRIFWQDKVSAIVQWIFNISSSQLQAVRKVNSLKQETHNDSDNLEDKAVAKFTKYFVTKPKVISK